jgi:hypothetical protein
MTHPCVTHHHACDCREAEFAGIVAELASLREDRDAQQRQAIQMMTERDALQAMIDASVECYAGRDRSGSWTACTEWKDEDHVRLHLSGFGDAIEQGRVDVRRVALVVVK